MRRLLLAPLLIVSTVLAAACGDDSSSDGADGGGGLDVVATTSVVGDFAQQVGGDTITLTVIMKPNVDAHDYEPSPADIEALRAADVVIRNGAGLESWFDETIDASGTGATIVDASDGVTILDDDPHIWHDPRNAVQMVTNITEAFVTADPDGATGYQARSDAFVGEIRALDAEIEAELATIAVPRLVTNHDAFGYYIERYGLEFVGSVIPSFDSSAELSASALSDLVEAIEEQGVKAVFAESSLPGDAARTIAEEAGVTVVTGDDALYGDSLGPADSDAATYLTMMRHNTETIASNLR